MEIKNVVVAGGGILGSQIAFQAAYCGFNVTIWSRSKASMEQTQKKLDNLKNVYVETINVMATPEGKSLNKWARGLVCGNDFVKDDCLKRVEEASHNIKIETSLKESLISADLVIEAIVEDFKAKAKFYQRISTYLEEKTVVVTNSSAILPSKLAKYIIRSENFLALHFANSIWKNNLAEVMKQKTTSDESFKAVIDFAENINMIALPIAKEKAGYLLNSMLIPFLFSGLDLYVNGFSDFESIDKAWTIGTGAPKGPFRILDTVGLKTAYNIVSSYAKIPSFLAPYNFKAMAQLLKQYIDEGKLGVSTGQGFYNYNK